MIARKLVSFKSDIKNVVQGYLITATRPNFNFIADPLIKQLFEAQDFRWKITRTPNLN